jgi:hypothetical protein
MDKKAATHIVRSLDVVLTMIAVQEATGEPFTVEDCRNIGIVLGGIRNDIEAEHGLNIDLFASVGLAPLPADELAERMWDEI